MMAKKQKSTVEDVSENIPEIIPEDKKYLVENVGTAIYEGLKNLDDFDTNWNTLISSTPLLFEDVDYARIKTHNHVNECITDKELSAYRDGVLRECYSTLDNLLMCNIEYYERIISFCTMVFFGYIRVDSERISRQGLKRLPLIMEMTPTKIWCCALMSTSSTQWEQMYAWEVFLEHQTLQENYSTILQHSDYFAPFIEYRAYINNTVGFRETLHADRTPNSKLATYCSKFTKASMAVSEQQLAGIADYCNRITIMTLGVSNAIYGVLSEVYKRDPKIGKYLNSEYFALFCFPKDLFILTGDLTMRYKLNEHDRLEKEYIANADKCIRMEEILAKTAGAQLAWCRQKSIFDEFEFERKQLYNILSGLIGDVGNGIWNYKNVVCVKLHNQPHCISKITFTGTRKCLKIHETFIFNSKELKEQRKESADKDTVIKSLSKIYGKENAINYILDRGYYIFGTESQVNALLIQIEKDLEAHMKIMPKTMINYYMNFCIPIITHMQDSIKLNEQYKNDVIDKYIHLKDHGEFPEQELSYDIISTNIKDSKGTFNARNILNNIVDKQASNLQRKNYWQIVSG